MLRNVMIASAKRIVLILRRLGLDVRRATPIEHFDWQSDDGAGCTAAHQAAPPNPLREFFDSRKQGPGIWKWNHYFDIYDRHYKPRFRGHKLPVHEIDGSGRDYFGPKARIYGV